MMELDEVQKPVQQTKWGVCCFIQSAEVFVFVFVLEYAGLDLFDVSWPS